MVKNMDNKKIKEWELLEQEYDDNVYDEDLLDKLMELFVIK
jgi:hypothetical protein